MNNFLSQLLSFAPVTVVPFIPNDALRYITLGVTLVVFVAYLLRRNTLGSRVGKLEDSMREMEDLFSTAADECDRDPYFLAETGLKLATLLSRKSVPWKKYLPYLREITRCIRDCQQELKELRWSTSTILKKDELEERVQVARRWTFPLANGACLVHDGAPPVQAVWLATAALAPPGVRRVLRNYGKNFDPAVEAGHDASYPLDLKLHVKRLAFKLESVVTQAAQDWENARDNVGALTAEATVATFLAAVQAQLIALSYQDNSTRLKVATNALGFAGLLLDVITACLALLASSILQRHIAIVEKQLTAIETATAEQLKDLTLPSLGLPYALDIRRRISDKTAARLPELQRPRPSAEEGDNAPQLINSRTEIPRSHGPDIRIITESLAQIRNALSIGDSASAAILYGVVCFFASVLCLAVASQPPAVWIVSAVVCSLFFVILPGANYVMGLLGIRSRTILDV
ncbi:hypothetical protein B0H14DRAFT_3165170 [Mycena olivaceomarginata]|nr:hypothetical protein B0H14DRAFT_3165170 [Mycena olivaceomarginata]